MNTEKFWDLSYATGDKVIYDKDNKEIITKYALEHKNINTEKIIRNRTRILGVVLPFSLN